MPLAEGGVVSARAASKIVDELEEIGSDLRGIACLMGDLGERTGTVDREGVSYLAGLLRGIDRRVHDLIEVATRARGAV